VAVTKVMPNAAYRMSGMPVLAWEGYAMTFCKPARERSPHAGEAECDMYSE